MNAPETTEWLAYHIALFPEYGRWWAENKSEELKSVWREECSHIDLQEAMEASRAMLSGEFGSEPPPPWDYNRLPVFIRRVVSSLRSARWEAQDRARRARVQKEAIERRRHYTQRTGEGQATEFTGVSRHELAAAIQRKQQDSEEKTAEVALKNIRQWGLTQAAGYCRRYRWAMSEEQWNSIPGG